MILGEVVGKIVATTKVEELNGKKLLLVAPICGDEVKVEEEFTSVDCVGAGVGDQVIVAFGGAARAPFNNERIPVDSSIVGIVDSIEKG